MLLTVNQLGLSHKALSVLRKYGTDAHVYLPGIGVINGLIAGNYLESTGSTPITVDNPVGLVLDGMHTVGNELLNDGSFSNPADWTAGTGWDITGGQAVHTSTAGAGSLTKNAFSLTSGKFYQVSFDRVDTDVQSINVVLGTNYIVSISGAGRKTIQGYANGTSFQFQGSGNYIIDNVSVKEVTGIHATQTATPNKPILRLSGGKYSWQFDGSNDYLSLGSVPFQMADDHCVIAGASNTAATGNRYIIDTGNIASSNALCGSIGYSGTNVIAQWRDDAATALSLLSAATGKALGEVNVISGRKVGTATLLRVNGALGQAGTISAGTTTLTGSKIGIREFGGNFYPGSIYPVIAIKGTVTDVDLLILERFVGKLSGVNI